MSLPDNPLRVIVRGPFSTLTGYGNDLIGISQALLAAGVDLSLQPTSVDPPLPQELCDLLTKQLKAPYDLLINHMDPTLIECKEAVTEAVKTRVAWTMWETTSLLTVDPLTRSKIAERTKFFDAVINYDRIGHDAVRPHLEDEVKSGIVQGGYWPQRWPYQERNWENPEKFVFCQVGVLGARKAPWDTIQAFNELQSEHPEEMSDVFLALKTSSNAPIHPSLAEVCKNIYVYNETWEEDTLRAFYGSCHCLLAPSRGEGKNMPALEMLSTGGTVIASDWGGHKGWLTEEIAYPIKVTLQPVDQHKFGNSCLWAVVDKEDFKAQMLRVVRNRDEARQKGLKGSQVIPDSHSWSVVMDRFFDKLEELVPEKGVQLNSEYKRCKAAHGNH